ncbi:CbiX/SirB N-terminal domain-containing protein [beta proteobacterium MWH-UniP1]
MTTGILLFAHGSRDPNWKRPFESILQQTEQEASGPVGLAFLESMQPDFAQGIASLVDRGAQTIRIVPLFLASGSHLRQDLPELVAQAKNQHPGIEITVATAIGEAAYTQAAIARYAAAS